MADDPSLILGPVLRHVGERDATVWVETDRACTVEVLGRRERTFSVFGRQYALVALDGLQPGQDLPYRVSLDGHDRWPGPDGGFPPSRIRTLEPTRQLRIVLGSCRHVPDQPPRLSRLLPHRGPGVDALAALSARLREDPRTSPDLLLMLGDQIYADDLPPAATFADYAHLYEQAWSSPPIRWMLSTVPTAMIFDDHEVLDDWNTSASWRAEMQATSWYPRRIRSALAAYWVYQHLGNLTPAELAADELYQRVRAVGRNGAADAESRAGRNGTGAADAGTRIGLVAASAADTGSRAGWMGTAAADGGTDATEILDRFAHRAGAGTDGIRWSYHRRFGRTHLVVIDSRAGRVLTGDRRDMLDDVEWRWLDGQLRAGDVDHLLVATSLPAMLPPAAHNLEAWNEAVCAGAWGPRAAGWAERLRRAIDLEHWAAFRTSFERLVNQLSSVAAGQAGPAPASILLLSGDVHYAYLADAAAGVGGLRAAAGEGERAGAEPARPARIHQIVCSPFCHRLSFALQLATRLACRPAMAWLSRLLARSAGVPRPPVRWRLRHGPFFHHELATLELTGRTARLRLEQTRGHGPGLRTLVDEPLT